MLIDDMSEEELARYNLSYVPANQVMDFGDDDGPDSPLLVYADHYPVGTADAAVLSDLIEEGADDVEILTMLVDIANREDWFKEDHEARLLWLQQHLIRRLASRLGGWLQSWAMRPFESVPHPALSDEDES